jgi:glycosyltransferase involved in cell wall biosynthesis
MPKVSVVILTFNRAKLLEQAIQSVLNQTFQDFEIIIVDDCSTDDTMQVGKNFLDERIKYIRHEVNKGVGAGRNTGVRNSTGEYIAFLDDDDQWLPEKLRFQVECLDCNSLEVGAVHCGRLDIDETNGTVLPEIGNDKRGDISKALLRRNFLTTSTVLLRTICFQKVGLFDETIPVGEDYDMWIRISQKYCFEYIELPLVRYSIHQNSLSRNLGAAISGYEALLQKYGQLFRQDPKEYHRRSCRLGVLYCLDGNTKKGRMILLEAIKIYPQGVKAYCVFLLSLFGTLGFRIATNIYKKRAILLA